MVRSKQAEITATRLAADVVARRAGGTVEAVVIPDRLERTDEAIDLAFIAAGTCFLLEHTLVQPLGDDVYLTKRFAELVDPLLEDLRGRVAADSQFDLWMDNDAAARIDRGRVDSVRSALRDWVLDRGPKLPLPARAVDSSSRLRERPSGVPFDVTLIRDRGNEGLVFAGRVMPEGVEQQRHQALIDALSRKCPKLATSATKGEITVLALEIANFALDNSAIVLRMLPSAFHHAGVEPPSLVIVVDARAYARGGDAVVDVVDGACVRDHAVRRGETWIIGRQGIARLR